MVSVQRQISIRDWNRSKLQQVLTRLKDKKILVIGDVGVDRYTLGSVERISPEAPVPIVLVEEERLKLGLAANVAENIRVLGGIPYLTGLVGVDRLADDFRLLLSENDISPRFLLVDPTRRTVLKERIVSERQQLLRVDYENSHSLSAETERALSAQAIRLVAEVDAVVIEDYAKGLITSALARGVFEEAKRLGKMTLVDPNAKTAPALYRGAEVLTPNRMEAEALVGRQIQIKDEASLLSVGKLLLEQTLARHVVVTLGKDGMAVFSAGEQECKRIPTFAREVYDVSGAGDTVISVLALALVSGADIEEAAILGNLAAGVEVSKRGTATVSRDEILDAMEFFGGVGGDSVVRHGDVSLDSAPGH